MPMISLISSVCIQARSSIDLSGLRWWPGTLLWQSLSGSRGFSCSCRRRWGNALGWTDAGSDAHCTVKVSCMYKYGSCLKLLFVFCIRVGSSFSCSRERCAEVRQMVMRKLVIIINTYWFVRWHYIPFRLDLNRHVSHIYIMLMVCRCYFVDLIVIVQHMCIHGCIIHSSIHLCSFMFVSF